MIQWYHRGSPWSGYNDIRRQILQHGSIQPLDLVKDNYDNLNVSTDPDKREGWMDRQANKRRHHNRKESV